MKKKIIAVLALMLILSACGKQEPTTETTVPPTTEAVTETTEVTTAPTVEETTEATTAPTMEETIPETTEPEGEPGVVIASSLNVREEPNINAKMVTQLKYGTQVTVYEQTTVVGMTWGRIDEGWVSMDYIKLGSTAAQGQADQTPAEPKPTEQRPSTPKPTEPKPTTPKPTEPKPTAPKPTEPKPTTPKPTEPKPTTPAPTEPKPTTPAPTEPKPTDPPAPTQCQHQWVPIKNIPAEYEYHGYVLCACGARFNNSNEWMAHTKTFSGEDVMNHMSYSSGTDQILIAPDRVLEQCSNCGATREVPLG